MGLIGTYLVTRTYLTGVLPRADRTTLGAFSRVGLRYAEVLVFQRDLRALNSRGGSLSPAAQEVAEKLAHLSLADLELPIEFALWAKAKSVNEDHEAALMGSQRAMMLCPENPELLLDYSVALEAAGQWDNSVARIEDAYRAISASRPPDLVKQVYKSLTYVSLYQPGAIGRSVSLRSSRADRRFPQAAACA